MLRDVTEEQYWSIRDSMLDTIASTKGKDESLIARDLDLLWEMLTYGYDPGCTETLIYEINGRFPWVSEKDIISSIKADFSQVRYALADAPAWQSDKMQQSRTVITKEQADAYWNFLLAYEELFSSEKSSTGTERKRTVISNDEIGGEYFSNLEALLTIAKDGNRGADYFEPLFPLLTNDFEPAAILTFLRRAAYHLPWIKTVDLIDRMTAQLCKIKYELSLGMKTEPATLDLKIVDLILDFLEAQRRVSVQETDVKAVPMDPVLDVPSERYVGLSALLENYITVPDVTGEEADRRLAFVIRFGRLPQECQNKKLEFGNYRGCKGDAFHFAYRLFLHQGDYLKIFGQCFNLDVKGCDKGSRKEPSVLQDERLDAFLSACKEKFRQADK